VLAPRRILLTGAGGFVGRHLCAALHAAYPGAALLTEPFDVCDADAAAAAIQAAVPEACVHLAGISTVAAAREDEDRAWRVNLHGTLNLAGAILRFVPACQLVFASTADAYGGSGGAITEDAPLAPRSVYAATKAAADLALGAMAGEGLRAIRLRPFNHTGPGQSGDFVVAAFARQIARIAAGVQAPVLEVGNLESWRDFLDVRDVCAAYVAVIARREALPAGLILNIGSGEARRIGDVLAELMTLAGLRAEVRAAPARVRAGDVGRARADWKRAQLLLGWRPTVPWSATLCDVLEDWRRRVDER
jgi:GDP-4-dehydro-6-deoxy-D-mannose reductase